MTEYLSACAAAPGGCLLCAIAAGRAPAHIVHADARIVAFLDIRPIRPGHLQIVPRDHYPNFNAVPDTLARELLNTGQRLADAQREVFGVDRVGFLFPADGLPHAQIHAVPLLSAGDVAARRRIAPDGVAFPAPPCATEAELAATARKLRDSLLRTVDNSVGWRPHPQTQSPHSR
jgi:histidine triad (HIT) family protein